MRIYPKKYQGGLAKLHLLSLLFTIIVIALSISQKNSLFSSPHQKEVLSLQTTQLQSIGQQSKTSGCVAQAQLPDKACTPGAVLSTASKDQICVSGYSKTVRNVTDAEKNAVFAEYGISSHAQGEYEVDHYISLELGGSNDLANLWPEPANPTPGFHQKDEVENYLHSQVCNNTLSLQAAQQEISTDWTQVYSQLH